MHHFVALALFAGALLIPKPVRACFVLPGHELSGYPADGAEDVPLDVIPVYQRSADPALLPWFALLPGDPALVSEVSLESERGSIAVTVRGASPSFWEFVPAEPLAPNTRYTLTVTWSDLSQGNRGDSLSFITGSAASSTDTSAPPASIANYSAEQYTDCQPGPESSCLSLPDDQIFMVEIVGDEHPNLVHGSFFVQRPIPELTFECLRIRRRAPNGALGEPTVICVEDGPLLAFAGEENGYSPISCDQQGLKWDGELVSEGATVKVGDEPVAAPETEEDVAAAEVRTVRLACDAGHVQRSPDAALFLLSMAAVRGMARAWRRRGASEPPRAS